MTDTPIPVTTTADIRGAHRDISDRDAETAARLLSDDAAAVVWLPAWLCEEKPLDYAHGDAQVAAVTVDRQTEKAWGVTQPGGNDVVWLPKSQAEAFTLAEGVAEVASEQRTLGDV